VGRIFHYSFANQLANIAISGLHIVAPQTTHAPIAFDDPSYGAIGIEAAQNVWIGDIAGENFAVGISTGARAINSTFQNLSFTQAPEQPDHGALRTIFRLDGQKLLCDHCITDASNEMSFATLSNGNGPNVILNSKSLGTNAKLQPHDR